MAIPRVERRLAAILAADIVGYSRFVGRYADALAAIERKSANSIDLQDMDYAAASAAILDESHRARLGRDRALAHSPKLAAEWHLRSGGTAVAHEDRRRRLAEAMVKAGFQLCATVEQASQLTPRDRLPECDAERARISVSS